MKFIIAVAASLPTGFITGLIVTAVANPSGDTEGIMKMTYGLWAAAIGTVDSWERCSACAVNNHWAHNVVQN